MKIRKPNKFTQKDRLKILEKHRKVGNKWKLLSFSFKNTNENEIKNQFFSLIRKSLRNARKILGLYSNTDSINKILPKVLTIFIKKKISVLLNNENTIIIDIYEFIIKYSNDKIIYDKIIEIDLEVIKKCLNFLNELNNDYLKQKKKKREIKNFKKFEKMKKNFVFKYENFLILKDKKKDLEDRIFLIINKDLNFDHKKNLLVSLYYNIGGVLKKMNQILTLMDPKEYKKIFINNKILIKNQNSSKVSVKKNCKKLEINFCIQKTIETIINIPSKNYENKIINNHKNTGFTNIQFCDLFNLKSIKKNVYSKKKKIIKILLN